MTLAKAAAMVTVEARARAWWRQHQRRRRRWWRRWRQRWAVGHHPGIVVDCGGKDIIAAAAIDRRCSQRWSSLPPLVTNDSRWFLAVVVVDCGSGDSSC